MPGLLKRKRSESELSFSSSTTLSSPPRPADNMAWPQSAHRLGSVPLYLASRTFKRCRSNRPSEELVHQYTMDLLYSAQQPAHLLQQQTPIQPADRFPAPVESPRATTAPATHQISLHNFWTIRQPASEPVVSQPMQAAAASHRLYDPNPSCEYCGTAVGCDGDLCMMDIDGDASESQERCCFECERVVCFSCSVSNLGEQRRCLQCAGRKTMADRLDGTI